MISYIPEIFYVGRNVRDHDEIVGFMTPITNDDAFKKRQATVDKWSNENLSAIEVSNQPQEGFKIVDYITRSSSSNVVWRILHPRGFQFEISSENFMDLIRKVDTKSATFTKPLLFVRKQDVNYLTYENSKTAEQAVPLREFTNKIPLKEINLGDTIRLKNGDIGIYLGRFCAIQTGGNVKGTMRYALLGEARTYSQSEFSVRDYPSLNVISIIKKTDSPLSQTEAYDSLKSYWDDFVKYDFSAFIKGIAPKLSKSAIIDVLQPITKNLLVTTLQESAKSCLSNSSFISLAFKDKKGTTYAAMRMNDKGDEIRAYEIINDPENGVSTFDGMFVNELNVKVTDITDYYRVVTQYKE